MENGNPRWDSNPRPTASLESCSIR